MRLDISIPIHVQLKTVIASYGYAWHSEIWLKYVKSWVDANVTIGLVLATELSKASFRDEQTVSS